MKKADFLKFLLLGLIIFLFIPTNSSLAENEPSICGVYFTGVGCSHCAKTDPIILGDLLKEYPNLIIIEYEIYQQRSNALLLSQYNDNYNSGLGIPLLIFNKDIKERGDSPILNNVRILINGLKSNDCPLAQGLSVNFNDIDITLLPKFPKIWYHNKILIKHEQGSNSKLLKELLFSDNLDKSLKNVTFEKIKPLKVSLSGKNVEFENAIKIDNWAFQWNGKGLKELIPEEPMSEPKPEPAASEGGEPRPENSGREFQPKLTLAKIISLAVVDAVNPCALAVLGLILITILAYSPNKRRNILLAGLAFIISVFIMYLIYGLVIIKSFQFIQALTSVKLWLYKALGMGAIILSFFKLRDFFRAKAVCKVKPRVNKIISKVTSPGSAFLVGIFVTVFLLPCTIGPYVICGGILSPLCVLKILPLLLLYNLIFILPMLAVVLIIYFGLSKTEDVSSWQAKNIRYLDLISGLIIGALGIAMILGLV